MNEEKCLSGRNVAKFSLHAKSTEVTGSSGCVTLCELCSVGCSRGRNSTVTFIKWLWCDADWDAKNMFKWGFRLFPLIVLTN